MTFDNVPWVATMKKNEHYFPTMEFFKDPSESCGWKRISYEGGARQNGVVASLTAETMDEGAVHDEDGGDVEG